LARVDGVLLKASKHGARLKDLIISTDVPFAVFSQTLQREDVKEVIKQGKLVIKSTKQGENE